MPELPATVRAFLDEHIFSASQLEVLLMLRTAPQEAVTLPELARRTALPSSSLGPWLDAFVSRGLLRRDDEAYWYAPSSRTVAAVLDEVADAWARRATTVTLYIYATAEDPLVRFADAFRFRRDERGRRPPGEGD